MLFNNKPGEEVDLDFLRNAINSLGKNQKAIYEEKLEKKIEHLAQIRTEYVYSLFDSNYNIANSAADPNFQSFKNSYREQIKEMYTNAVTAFYNGDTGSIFSLIDATYESDRQYNIGGELFTKRELDDAIYLIQRGEYKEKTTLQKDLKDSGLRAELLKNLKWTPELTMALMPYQNADYYKLKKIIDKYKQHIIYS